MGIRIGFASRGEDRRGTRKNEKRVLFLFSLSLSLSLFSSSFSSNSLSKGTKDSSPF